MPQVVWRARGLLRAASGQRSRNSRPARSWDHASCLRRFSPHFHIPGTQGEDIPGRTGRRHSPGPFYRWCVAKAARAEAPVCRPGIARDAGIAFLRRHLVPARPEQSVPSKQGGEVGAPAQVRL